MCSFLLLRIACALSPFFLAAVCASAIYVTPTAQPASKAQGNEVDKTVQKTVDASTQEEAAEAFRLLFKRSGSDGFDRWKVHENDGIAIRAAWEDIVVSLGKKQRSQREEVDAKLTHRFVGFLEGRLAAALPPWWEESLLRMQVRGRTHTSFPLPSSMPFADAGLGYLAPAGTSLQKSHGLLLKVGKDSIRVPEAVVKVPARGLNTRLTSTFDAERCYLAVHKDQPYSYDVICLKRSEGTILWRSKVWADQPLWTSEGIGSHFVSIVAQKSSILVFGTNFVHIYIEGFRATDGKVLFRFSTFY